MLLAIGYPSGTQTPNSHDSPAILADSVADRDVFTAEPALAGELSADRPSERLFAATGPAVIRPTFYSQCGRSPS
jgi:hypothetical protein